MNGAEISRPPVHRITLAQLTVIALVCLISYLVTDPVRSYSLFCGGPNL